MRCQMADVRREMSDVGRRRAMSARRSAVLCLSLGLSFLYAFAQVRPIRDVRQNDSQGNPLLNGQSVTVTGRVTEAGHFGGWGPAYVQDATGGVAIYGSQVGSISIGDSITVTGTVKPFYGLAELDPISNLVNHGAAGTPAGRVEALRFIDQIDTAAGYVENEGWLASFEKVFIIHTPGQQFAGNQNYTVADAGGYNAQLRIDADCGELVGMTIPDDSITLTGIVAQYKPSAPYLGGYQLMPRVAADVGAEVEVMSIADAIKDENGDRKPDRLGQSVTVTGTATVASGVFNPTYLDIYVQDATAGVNVFSFAMQTVAEGDSFIVSGTVDQYRGKTEISDAALTLVASGRPLPEPRVITCSQVPAEQFEGQLVKVEDVTAEPGVLEGNSNYDVTDQTGTATMRIDGDTDIPGLELTAEPFTLVGIVSQYAYDTVNLDDGYQLTPRSRADFSASGETLPLITIAEAQRPGADGVTPALLDSVVRVRGRVTGPASSFTSGSYKSLYIEDGTQGANIYRCSYPQSQELFLDSLGIEWEVIGTVTEYNGLTEIAMGSMRVTDSNAVPVTPRSLPYNAPLTEGMESDLVTFVGDVVQPAVRSGSGYNVTVKNGTPAVTIRINDIAGVLIGEYLRKAGSRVRFTGVVGQYDYEAPFNTGYQLLPRFNSDVRDTTAGFPPAEQVELADPDPNPFSPAGGQVATIQVNAPASWRLTVTIFDMDGRAVRELLRDGGGGYHEFKWDGTGNTLRALPAGTYLVNVKAVKPGGGVATAVRPVVIAFK